MALSFLREEAGKTMRVEFWEENGKIVMLRRTTWYVDHGKQRKFRQDIPEESPTFRKELRKELRYMQNMTKMLQNLITNRHKPELKTEQEPESKPEA